MGLCYIWDYILILQHTMTPPALTIEHVLYHCSSFTLIEHAWHMQNC
jgi:hypothetical protein